MNCTPFVRHYIISSNKWGAVQNDKGDRFENDKNYNFDAVCVLDVFNLQNNFSYVFR